MRFSSTVFSIVKIFSTKKTLNFFEFVGSFDLIDNTKKWLLKSKNYPDTAYQSKLKFTQQY